MSNKVKSSLYLSGFILAFIIYNFSMVQSENNYNDSSEIALAELDEVTPSHNLRIEDPQ